MPYKILISSGNKAKIQLVEKLILSIAEKMGTEIEVLTPVELGLQNINPEEVGTTVQENAYLKAKGYWEALPTDQKIPCLGIDIAGIADQLDDENQPGLNLRRRAGKKMSDDEAIQFYSGLAEESGGEIKFNFEYGICLFAGYSTKIDPLLAENLSKIGIIEQVGVFSSSASPSTIQTISEVCLVSKASREAMLTTEVVGKIEPGMPLSSMWKSVSNGKYLSEMNQVEFLDEFNSISEALFDILVSLPVEGDLTIGQFKLGMRARPRSLGIIRKADDTFIAFIKNYGGSKDQLSWVGGGVDFAENPEISLVREIKEELGYTQIESVKPLPPKVYHFYEGSEYMVNSVTFGFEVQIADYSIKVPAEIDDGRYTLRPIGGEQFLNESRMDIAKLFLARLVK
ncbi:MAG: hypothetical protein OHK0017_05190 [Patescibacteria group bacterium]